MWPYSSAGEMLKKLLPEPEKPAGEKIEVFPVVPDHREKEFLEHQLWIKREIMRITFYPFLGPTPWPLPERPKPLTDWNPQPNPKENECPS